MNPAWLQGGARVVDRNGATILCNVCPCDKTPPPPAPCCVGTTARRIWLYLSYSAEIVTPGTPPEGCVSLHACPPRFVVGPTNVFYTSDTTIETWANAHDPISFLGTIACWPVRVRSTCIADVPFDDFLMGVAIDFDGTGFGAGGIGSDPKEAVLDVGASPCSIVAGCNSASLTDAAGGIATAFVSYTDPAAGIVCPDGSVQPLEFTFSITLTKTIAGIPTPTMYTTKMRFRPNGSGANFSGQCYFWQGCWTNCHSLADVVELSYNVGTGLWSLTVFEDANSGILADNHQVIFAPHAAPFPTSGFATGDFHFQCGTAGLFPPWSLT